MGFGGVLGGLVGHWGGLKLQNTHICEANEGPGDQLYKSEVSAMWVRCGCRKVARRVQGGCGEVIRHLEGPWGDNYQEEEKKKSTMDDGRGEKEEGKRQRKS